MEYKNLSVRVGFCDSQNCFPCEEKQNLGYKSSVSMNISGMYPRYKISRILLQELELQWDYHPNHPNFGRDWEMEKMFQTIKIHLEKNEFKVSKS